MPGAPQVQYQLGPNPDKGSDSICLSQIFRACQIAQQWEPLQPITAPALVLKWLLGKEGAGRREGAQ